MAKGLSPQSLDQDRGPHETLWLGNVQCTFFPRNGKEDLHITVHDESGAPIVSGDLRGVTKGYVRGHFAEMVMGGRKFLGTFPRKVLPQEHLSGTLASSTLNSPPFEHMSTVSPVVEPSDLRRALFHAIKRGARFSRSVERFCRSIDQYKDQQNTARLPDVSLGIIDPKSLETTFEDGISKRSRPRKKLEGKIAWVDIDMQLPHGSLNEESAFELVKQTLPNALRNEEFKYFQLRGFSIDPDDPDSVIRRKLIVFVGEKYLITLHDGPIDNLDRPMQCDSIESFRKLLSGKAHSLGAFSGQVGGNGETIGPGQLFLDLFSLVVEQQEFMLKRFDRRVDDARSDQKNRIPRKLRVRIDPYQCEYTFLYVQRKIAESVTKIEELRAASKMKVLEKMFGVQGLSPEDGRMGGIVDAKMSFLEHRLERVLNHMNSISEKVMDYDKVREDMISKEREHRNYMATLASTIIIPLFLSVELTQVPWEPIVTLIPQILRYGVIASAACALGFVTYDRWRKRQNPSLNG